MSDTDSFIDEVSEEIRREKLFKTFRKYGWIGVALVVIVVGGTGYREYSRAAENRLGNIWLFCVRGLAGKRPIRTCCAIGYHHGPECVGGRDDCHVAGRGTGIG